MLNFLRTHKLITALVLVPFVLLATGLAVLNWFFEEDTTTNVRSIAHHVGATSVLAVFAHPDDEQLVTGLLIRAAEDPDIHTAAVTATRGEAGTPLPQISRLSDLGTVRMAETLKNTWALGVDAHDVLAFPDGGLVDISIEELKAAVLSRFLAHRPDLIVTFWPESGFSNHPDHKRMGLVAELVTRELQTRPIDGYTGPTYIAYALAPTRMMSRFAGETGARVVANQPAANFEQDGEAWAKLRGWEIHASQRNYVQHAYGLPDWLVHRLYDKEHYYLLPTRDLPERILP